MTCLFIIVASDLDNNALCIGVYGFGGNLLVFFEAVVILDCEYSNKFV